MADQLRWHIVEYGGGDRPGRQPLLYGTWYSPYWPGGWGKWMGEVRAEGRENGYSRKPKRWYSAGWGVHKEEERSVERRPGKERML